MNAWKNGRQCAAMRAWRREAIRFIALDRLLRDAIFGRAMVADPAVLVTELTELARRLSEGLPAPPSAATAAAGGRQ